MSGSDCPWRTEADGLMLVVRLTPKGGRDAVETVEQLVSRFRSSQDIAAPSDANFGIQGTPTSI
jgi:uncharacterized protein YggU (UPF0235/DUF167 family)